jgi:hypothetical protein
MTTLQRIALVSVLVLLVLVGSRSVMASDTFPGIFNSVYPASQTANNASCRLCHTTSTSQLNGYGKDFAIQFRGGLTEAQSFQAIENLNSDNDPTGAANIAEINANAQPGWTPGANNTIYSRSTLAVVLTNQNPPATITGDLDPPAPAVGAKVGVYRPSTNTFYLDSNGSGTWNGCTTDSCIGFGIAGDVALLGDWNGTGTARVGAYRPSDGTFYLDYNGNGAWDGCAVDRCIVIGTVSDIPVVGDWNGSGTTKVGFFRPSSATFFLDYDGNGVLDGCVTDKCIAFGDAADTPVVGDWNGSGTTKIGAFRPNDRVFYLDFNGNGLWDGCGTDRCIAFGAAGDIPVVGDWNGSGTSKVGAFRPSAGTFYLDYNGNGGWEGCTTDKCVVFGAAGDAPVIAQP